MTFFYDLNKRLSDIAGKSEPEALTEGAKPDFLDLDKDGNRKESMKKAAQDRAHKVSETGRPGTSAPAPTTAPAPTAPKKTPFTYTIQGSDKVYGGGSDNDPLASGELDKASNPWPKESTGDYSAKKARAGKDIGKPGKAFAKIAADAGKRYGSKAAGERVAGAVLNKLRKGVKEDGADLRDLSQFPTTPGGAAMGNPSIANQAAKARDMKEDSAPKEKVSAVIKRVLGDKLLWGRRISELRKSPRANYDRYLMQGIRVYDNFGGNDIMPEPFSANAGQPLAKKLKRELIKAGYPVSSDLIIYPEAIMFNVRKPTTTAEQGVAEAQQVEEMDKSQTPPGRDGGHQFEPGPKVSKKVIKAVTKDPAKYLSDLFAKEYDKKKKGVAEGAGNIGAQIRAAYQRIYDQGDDAVEFAYYDSPIFAQYWDEYEGDLDSIIAEVDPSELQIILDELTSAAEDQGVAEGNDFTGARLAAIKAGKNTFTVDGKTYRVTGDTSDEKMSEGRIDDLMDKRREAGKLTKPEKSGVRFVAGKAYGGSAQKDEPEDDEEEVKSDQPKKRGRPAGTGRKIGAKGPTRKSKLAYGESADGMAPGAMAGDEGEYGNEGDMAKDQIHTIVRNARQMEKILSNQEDLPEWVQAKLAKIEGMMTAVSDYIQTQHEREMEEPMAEVAPPGAKAERMVKHIKKSLSKDGKLSDRDKAIAYATTWKAHNQGKVEEESTDTRDKRAEKAGRKVTKDIEYDEKNKDGIHGKKRGAEDAKAEKAGRKVAKDIEYDEKHHKVKEEGAAAPKAKAGMQFGKGIYDSLNRDVESLITESMNVSVNMSVDEHGEPHKNITVSAEGDDAEKLAEILKLAGLHGGDSSDQDCEVCGSSPCGCAEQVDENHPDWPTNTETSGDALQYSGGLDGPKSTGQTVDAPFNRQDRRQGAMESRDLGMSLYQELKSFKG